MFATCCLSVTVVSQTRDTQFSEMGKKLNIMQSKQVDIDKKLKKLSNASVQNKKEIQSLTNQNKDFQHDIDSLINICLNLEKAQEEDRKVLNRKIQDTNNTILFNQSTLTNRTIWGSVIAMSILVVLLITFYYLIKRIKIGASSISEVRKAQNALQSAQAKIEEESVKLDNKLLEIAEKQLPIISTTTDTMQDHSLTLKIADELVRIEMNLSRMDTSVKGYKQLAKAVQRIKDNFNANGYEIVDMLGKTYVAGMKAAVTFATDGNLENGQQIITKIIKPQINYQQQMIQAAQIEVSQPE